MLILVLKRAEAELTSIFIFQALFSFCCALRDLQTFYDLATPPVVLPDGGV